MMGVNMCSLDTRCMTEL